MSPTADIEVKTVVAQAAGVLEMIQAFYLIADDIIDQSESRRGKLAWYKTVFFLIICSYVVQSGIGLSAINDAFLLDVGAQEILRQLYPAHPQVDRICQAYNRSKKITVLGQLLDGASQGKLKEFTWERYFFFNVYNSPY